ncbi:MAG: gamma-glutamyltransferase family protein [Lachnospiraceae bacterium]|nr:gamma-glutamyltransferase family protein [Lachnospiraceae bacterium]
MNLQSEYAFTSQRMVTLAANGMVASSQALASQAGLEILKKGGNAVDAAIATAAMLVVVEPTSNGFGGDAFAQVWMDGKLYALNSSGFAPALLDREAIRKAVPSGEIPRFGWESVTVPGIPKAWGSLWRRFGSLPFEELLAPAISYAENGFVVTPVIAKNWKKDFEFYQRAIPNRDSALFASFFDTFMKDGKTPKAGERYCFPDHAGTLRELAATACESFYHGALADRIHEFSVSTGGYLRKEDLERYEARWVEPVKVSYRGYEICELPPNGHGLVALMALNILENFHLQGHRWGEDLHQIVEAMKLAYEDGKEYIADPKCMRVSVEELLDPDYAKARGALIGEKALDPKAGNPQKGGTVYFCSADRDGNMVSMIQSNYMDFGSGVVVPGTGIAFHNRGCNFSMDPTKGNCLAPGKYPYHTIIPGFLMKDGTAVGAFGVMGDFMQPQGHVQVITDLLDYALNPQQALDAPRWRWRHDKTVEVETNFPEKLKQELIERGHDVVVVEEAAGFGRGQIILRDERGTYTGATEPRADGAVACY